MCFMPLEIRTRAPYYWLYFFDVLYVIIVMILSLAVLMGFVSCRMGQLYTFPRPFLPYREEPEGTDSLSIPDSTKGGLDGRLARRHVKVLMTGLEQVPAPKPA
jgi:hypothetical protein